jgi:hypothetical protein
MGMPHHFLQPYIFGASLATNNSIKIQSHASWWDMTQTFHEIEKNNVNMQKKFVCIMKN